MNLAKLISDAVESFNSHTGDDSMSFCGAYSGRGMYGRECVGITGPASDCRKVIAMVINDAWDVETDSDFDVRGMVETLLAWEQDSMGHNVILYWRDIQQEEQQEEVEFVTDVSGAMQR